MPREIAVFGVMLPTLLPLCLAGMLLQMTVDRVLNLLGVYRRVWHPALVRLCLFMTIFGGLVLLQY